MESILAVYEAECAAELDRQMDSDPSEYVGLVAPSGSVWDIEIGSDGQTATVVHANFDCPGFGTLWCGSGGCDNHIVVGEADYTYFGYRPFSTSDLDGRRFVILPVQGGACSSTGGARGYTAAPCFRVAYWDDKSREFWMDSDHLTKGTPLHD
ncbi:hypothetical protein STA1M1_33310 [Sinisalibacter aestuarii]|uniref:Uncharacterized protein n=1 Tax=Sinisalibacter aestuarii TaxID=2949426 RepID=A0ABQ5LWV2_9RHOB|nr:hypothetical protein STA1M1_33310 [Sinisalibacter aestuarii]